jgi:hypothetical protein
MENGRDLFMQLITIGTNVLLSIPFVTNPIAMDQRTPRALRLTNDRIVFIPTTASRIQHQPSGRWDYLRIYLPRKYVFEISDGVLLGH